MRAVVGTLLVVSAAVMFMSAGPAQAGIDDEFTIIDERGRMLTVQQWETNLQGVAPLDRNRLTREWFHSGRAKYIVGGPGSADFDGFLELGYQIGFPWSLGVGINFSYTTPNILVDDNNIFDPPVPGLDRVITPNLLPGASISVDLGNGPGLLEVATFSVGVTGQEGEVAVSNAHGTVTGAAGGVLLRPFARLIASNGENVTTYGDPWNMN